MLKEDIAILGMERLERGYYLVEPEYYLIWLCFDHEKVATFTPAVSVDELRREADRDWERRNA